MEEKVPRLNKDAFSIVSLSDSDDDLSYWQDKTPLERLSAIEINRRMVYGYDRATSRLQRILEIDELSRD